MRKLALPFVLLFLASLAAAQSLSVTQSGSGNTATITVTSSNLWQLTWSAKDNWAADGWCDLVNDSACTTNYLDPAYGVNGSAEPCVVEDGLANFVFYSEGDEKQFMRMVNTGCTFSAATRSMTVVSNTPSLVVLQSTSIPVSPSSLSSLLTGTMYYYIYPSGQIRLHYVISASGTFSFGSVNNYMMMMSLPDSLQTGTLPPDSQSVGWVRASATQNPYNYVNGPDTYLYAYWGSSSGAWGYGSSLVPKVSLMIVPSPNNPIQPSGQLQHSWACGAGCGVVRLGYQATLSNVLAPGQTMTWDWMVQLGTKGSSVLPDLSAVPPANCSACSTIASAYIANPSTPPTGGGLLTGMTPFSFTTPSGWTVYATQDFESGTFGPGGAYGTGNFVTNNYHPDGNVAHTHSIECQVGGQPDCNGSVSWNRPLPVGTREVYESWYEWLDTSFRMNDEMFLTRFWWNTGTGQPIFRESILDYFQDATQTYNSQDATLLWNIQGQPYFQNRLPSNTFQDRTNFSILTGQWVQHEVYVKFSTFAASVSVPGTVTLNATAQTYTCSTCNWTTLGLHVGDSPHFTGFSSDANNGAGAAGGGGTAYTVQSMTSSVLTMSAMPFATNEGPVSGTTVQVDHGDGAYQYYRNGALVGSQSAMVFPGLVDFSTQATNLSIGESYSKLIWHQQVGGVCETTAPFTGTCSTNISACGYDNLYGGLGSGQYGWNGAGLTATTLADEQAGNFTAHIRCDATWGGPMPTPPVFKRYLDDIIVLTKTATAHTISPSSATIPVSGTQQFSTDITSTWTASSGTITGTGTTSGFYTAPATAGSAIVTATYSGGSSTASVNIQALSVTPATASLTVGATQQFNANFSSTWSASCGSITSSGLYTAPSTNNTCTITATATNGGTTATATVTVTGQQTTIPLSISPTSWTATTLISTTITQTFTASNVGTGSVTPTVTLSGAAPFTISANTCTGVVAGGGNCTVTIQFLSATVGTFSANLNISDTAGGNQNIPLSVSIPSGTTVIISPKTAAIPAGGHQQFSASTSNGSSVTWSTDCATGSVTTGFFTDSAAEVCTVSATSTDGSGANDIASVTVVTFAVSPVAVTIQSGAQQQFTANFAATFSVTSGSCTTTSSGFLTAGSVGSCVLTAVATNGGATATATISVVAAPPTTKGGSQKGGNGKWKVFH